MSRHFNLAALCIMTWLATLPTFAGESEITSAHRPGIDRYLVDGQLFTDLVYATSETYGVTPKPFLYPIVGPNGIDMTRSYPMRDNVTDEARDHPHHRSLWFAHGDVNGVDFWTEGEGKGVIRVTNRGGRRYLDSLNNSYSGPQWSEEWISPDDQQLLTSETWCGIRVLDDNSRMIDVQRLLSVGRDVERVTFGDTKEGTMAIRLHPALRLKGPVATGHCVNSEGDTDGDCWGKRAKWVAYWGVIDGKTCGVAIFDHPTNLRHPTWWHARDYGLVAANPFGIHDFENKPEGTGDYQLEWGESLELRYCFVFFEGTAEEADVASKYNAWVVATTADDAQEDEEE